MKNNLKFILILFCFSSTFAQQENSLLDFEKSRQNINQTAMLVLGSWAVGNILLGTYGNFKTKNETKYFHQFNAMWNSVNLGIAVYGYLNAVNSNSGDMTNLEILKGYSSLQNFLLLNAGLDVAYIMTGLYLKEKSKSSAKTEMLKGFGNSLLLQGGFLLLFDVVLYFIHQNNAEVLLYPNLENIISGGVGIGMNLRI